MKDENVLYGNDDLRIRVEDAENYSDDGPRDWCPVSTLDLTHRRYNLPCEGDSVEFVHKMMEFMPLNDAAHALVKHLKRAGSTVVMPVFGYDHGGLVLSTGPNLLSFPDYVVNGRTGWDSGLLGFVYDTPDSWVEWSPTLEEREKTLAEEVELYSQWSNGEVYYLVTEEWNAEMELWQMTDWDAPLEVIGWQNVDREAEDLAKSVGLEGCEL